MARPRAPTKRWQLVNGSNHAGVRPIAETAGPHQGRPFRGQHERVVRGHRPTKEGGQAKPRHAHAAHHTTRANKKVGQEGSQEEATRKGARRGVFVRPRQICPPVPQC